MREVSMDLSKLIDKLNKKELKDEKKAKGVDKKIVVNGRRLIKKERQIFHLAKEVVMPDNYHTIWTLPEMEKFISHIKQHTEIAVDTETTGLDIFNKDKIVGMSFYFDDTGYYIPLYHIDDIQHNEIAKEAYEELLKSGRPEVGKDFIACPEKQEVINYIRPILEDKTKQFIFHNAKFDIHVIKENLSINVEAYFDTLIAFKLLNENTSAKLKDLSVIYLGLPADKFSTLFGKILPK